MLVCGGGTPEMQIKNLHTPNEQPLSPGTCLLNKSRLKLSQMSRGEPTDRRWHKVSTKSRVNKIIDLDFTCIFVLEQDVRLLSD